MNPDVSEYLSSLKNSKKFGPQVVYHKMVDAKASQFADDFPQLDSKVTNILVKRGFKKLYTHQKNGIDLILDGKDVLIATPTASGKSMIYNLPVLHEFAKNKGSTSLYLFPLKALAQDQKNVLETLYNELSQGPNKSKDNFCALFDGDSSSYARRKIKDNPPNVLLSNPEMLHLSMLPYHQGWIDFFSNLKYVVIDEVHTYRGVVGSHMAWVLRRLQRIANYYGSRPQFIMLSATIGNPEKLGADLIGRNIEVITESGAPAAEKNVVFINPWDSAPYMASQLLEAAIKRGLRTIVYTQSRKMTELINMWTSQRLGNLGSTLSAYRAGFLPEERREIEAQLFSGKLLGVISTSALELGIDIGDLDLCVLVGYPGSVMATWQRGGRVGRSMRKSAIVLIAGEDALDQHYMRNPEDFFKRQPESAVLNPANEAIVDQHLHCCGAELPLEREEIILKNKVIRERVDVLSMEGKLLETDSGGRWVSSRKYPQRDVTLRGGGTQMVIVNSQSGEIIGEIDTVRGLKECHPGAVYLHRSKTWIVESFDPHSKEVVVTSGNPKYFTRPLSEKQTEILAVTKQKYCLGLRVSFGKLRVRERVTGYQKRHNYTHKFISTTPLELPEQIIETEGLWVDIPPAIVNRIEAQKLHFMGGIHAMEHGMIALMPLLVLCDRNDIGGISCPLHEQTESASVFMYDGYAGGIGLADDAYEKIEELLAKTLQTITTCECETGCPSCVHSPKCGSGNRPIDKTSCIHLLQEITKNKEVSDKDFQGSQKNPTKQLHIVENQGNTRVSPKGRGLDSLPERFCVFDLETIRSADEVGGWSRVDKMGMSVGVVYDSIADDCITYLENEAEQLVQHLCSFDLVVGFNNKRFDNRVLSAYTKVDLHILPNLDILEEVHKQLGYRLSLNGLATHSLGAKKSADGLQALAWYKEGRIDLIQKYCRKDVEITRDLLLLALEQGYLVFSNKAGKKVRLPLRLDETIERLQMERESC